MKIEILEKPDQSTGSFIKKATRNHRSVVVDILCNTFVNDPHMNWLLEKSSNPNKLKIMMSYLFDETINIGDIYLTKDEKAVALWKSEKKEMLDLEYIKRNFMFLIDIGLPSVIRILRNERFTYKQYPRKSKYFHLYLIGVLPEYQRKGYASRLMNPILEEKSIKSIPVYLETANMNNVRIYARKGFKLYTSWIRPGLELYYMKKSN